MRRILSVLAETNAERAYPPSCVYAFITHVFPAADAEWHVFMKAWRLLKYETQMRELC